MPIICELQSSATSPGLFPAQPYVFEIQGMTDKEAEKIIAEYTTQYSDYAISAIVKQTVASITAMQPNEKHQPAYQRLFQENKTQILELLTKTNELVSLEKHLEALELIKSTRDDSTIIRGFRNELQPLQAAIESASTATFKQSGKLTLKFNNVREIDQFLEKIHKAALDNQTLSATTQDELLSVHHAVFNLASKEIHAPIVREQLGSYRR